MPMENADRVMSVAEAHRLDKPERLQWLPPDLVLGLLPLRSGMTVADVGAGTGYFAIPIARAIASEGKVFAIRPQRSPSASACEPYQEVIELGLGRGRNAMAIWQDLVSFHGFATGYQSVKRFVRRLRGTQTPPARVVIVTAPGEESQVDYGAGPMPGLPTRAEMQFPPWLRPW